MLPDEMLRAMRHPAFAVTVHYREPTYEKRAGAKPEPYRWTFEIVAPSERQARDRALALFKKMESLSGVGWTREVVKVECRVLGDRSSSGPGW